MLLLLLNQQWQSKKDTLQLQDVCRSCFVGLPKILVKIKYFHLAPAVSEIEPDWCKLLDIVFQANFTMESHTLFILSQFIQHICIYIKLLSTVVSYSIINLDLRAIKQFSLLLLSLRRQIEWRAKEASVDLIGLSNITSSHRVSAKHCTCTWNRTRY